jgi:fermentation-respiration switch protein FrsA (DUF1100 family)
MEDFAGDALAGIDYLKTRKEIDRKRIGLIGHSEGGTVAPMAASNSSDVAFIVMMAAPGVTGEELLYLEGEVFAKTTGASAEAVRRQRTFLKAVVAVAKDQHEAPEDEKKVRELYGKVLESLPAADVKALGDLPESDVNAAMKKALSPWFRHYVRYDPRPTLKKVKCPVLAIHGERDLQVPARVNLSGIATALRAGGNQNVTTISLSNLNHLFQTCETGSPLEYERIEETMSPVALEAIANWIRQTADRLAKQ